MTMPLTSNPNKNWNKEQKEVWGCVETHWEHLINKRVDEFIKFIHPDMIGYGHESPLPVDRPWLEKWVGFWTQTTQIVICELRPVDIRIYGDIAIIQYLIYTIEMSKMDQGKRVIRRYTMTWQKGKDRWVVIASHNNILSNVV